jgi:hypothetical protein
LFLQCLYFVDKIREIMKIKEEEFNQPTWKKWGWPMNVGGKRKTPKKVATRKEDF